MRKTLALVIFLSSVLFAEILTGKHRLTCLNQTVTAVEGSDATLQCHLEPQADLSTSTFAVKRTDLDVSDRVVYSYRNKQDDPQPPMERYRNRAALIREDLTKGILTLLISSVQLSDSGPYKFYIPTFNAGNLINVTVVEKDEQSRTNTDNSSSTGPTVEDETKTNIPDAGKETPPWLIVTSICVIVLVLGSVGVFILIKYGGSRKLPHTLKKKLRGHMSHVAEAIPDGSTENTNDVEG